jgi:hypothetical protein
MVLNTHHPALMRFKKRRILNIEVQEEIGSGGREGTADAGVMKNRQGSAWLCLKVRNTTDGSWWIVQILSTEPHGKGTYEIPPTEVGG